MNNAEKPVLSATETTVICPCSGTTYQKVQQLYGQGFDLEAIGRKTGLLSGCGGCASAVTEWLACCPAPPKR
ncbi:MAG: (2Fe-2S)-binding protein [Methylococcales bacterium]|nr:(2Fe-2S)-binding protein [Methylococcales bacterium]